MSPDRPVPCPRAFTAERAEGAENTNSSAGSARSAVKAFGRIFEETALLFDFSTRVRRSPVLRRPAAF
jgi:hypothetical protein